MDIVGGLDDQCRVFLFEFSKHFLAEQIFLDKIYELSLNKTLDTSMKLWQRPKSDIIFIE